MPTGAVHALEGALKLTFVLQEDMTGELFQFGVHTASRNPSDYPALELAMDDLIGALPSTARALTTYVRAVISEWQVGGAFDGWHQVYSIDKSVGGGSGPILPPQCSLVVGIRSADAAYPLRSRRNRSYIGLLASGTLGGDGRVTSAFRDAVSSAFAGFEGDLVTVPNSVGWVGLEGLDVASPALGLLLEGTDLVVGRAVDTQRRRRQQTLEEATHVAI